MTPLIILTFLIFLAAVGAVWKARPVHAALFLALSLALVAVMYLTLGLHFIGLVQFSVYVGAVAVLIVFALLITRPSDEIEEVARRPRSMAVGLFYTLPVLALLVYAITKAFPVELAQKVSATEAPVVSVEKLGLILFTTHTPAVLAVGVMLTSVMIGAALFAREIKK